MATTNTDIRVPITGSIWSAVFGTAFPADIGVAPAAPWMDHGYTTADGMTMVPNIDSADIEAWQSASPVRTVVRKRVYEFKFKLIQSSRDNTILVHGGGAWTGTAGKFVYTPPVGGGVDRRTWLFAFTDGTIHKRYLVPLGIVTSIAEVKMAPNEAIGYDVTVKVIGDNWSLQSDDPADDPAGLGTGGAGELFVDPSHPTNPQELSAEQVNQPQPQQQPAAA